MVSLLNKIIAWFMCSQVGTLPHLPTLEQRIAQCMQISALGDAQGRVTEFISSVDAIFERYPQGVRSFDDFQDSDWYTLPARYKPTVFGRGLAPYTDDTRMALLVCEQLIEAKKHHWNLEMTMSAITVSFIHDLHNTIYGWGAPFRAPGNGCLKGVRRAEQQLLARGSTSSRWWDAHASEVGGCGSVMRAYPFGLVFSDESEKAKLWAVEHSKITHGHPIALAACAAMAVGTAHALAGLKNHDEIIEIMIQAAEEYDKGTATKMKKALEYASLQQNRHYSSVYEAFKDTQFCSIHEAVFQEFQAWAADDAIAAAVYVWKLFPTDYVSALYVSVHTPGDSDSIAAMAGALVGAYAQVHLPKETIAYLEDSSRIEEIAHKIIGCAS